MRSFVAGLTAALAALALALQLLLPSYVAGRAEDRLEQGGGAADVSVSAFPSLTLLAGRGGSFEARGNGLSFDLDERREDPFERLDGFGRVDVALREVDAGALRMRHFELVRRERGEDYDLRVGGTTTPRELAAELGGLAAGPLGRLVGGLATGVLPGGGRIPLPIELRAVVASSDGRPQVRRARGSVAGIPADPLASVVLSVVLNRL